MSSEDYCLRAYISDIRKFPSITVEEEIKLADQIKSGDEDAREKFITSNLRLVVKLAKEFNGLGLSILDLIAEGNIGLTHAIEKYDPSKGTKFGSFASRLIQQAFRMAIQEKGRTIRLPAAAIRKLKKIERVRRQLKESLGREPQKDEIAEKSGISIREIIRLEHTNLKIVSIHDPLFNDESTCLEDLLYADPSHSPDVECDHQEEKIRLGKLFGILSEIERDVIIMRFGLEGEAARTLEQVAKEVGCTCDKIQQIETRAFNKLRDLIYDDFKSNNSKSSFSFSSEILSSINKFCS